MTSLNPKTLKTLNPKVLLISVPENVSFLTGEGSWGLKKRLQDVSLANWSRVYRGHYKVIRINNRRNPKIRLMI